MQDAGVIDAQRRLLLVLRSQHGPRSPQVWWDACAEAGVVASGQLSADELERVAGVLVGRGGADAVAGRTCRVRLLFLKRVPALPPPPPVPAPRAAAVYPAGLDDASVRAAFAEPDALPVDAWQRRLAELEAELA